MHFSLERAGAHLLLHRRQAVLWKREVSVDGIESLDHKQRITGWCAVRRAAVVSSRTARAKDVANVHQTLAGATVDGRANVTVTQLYLGVIDSRRTYFDCFVCATYRRAIGFNCCVERISVRSQL